MDKKATWILFLLTFIAWISTSELKVSNLRGHTCKIIVPENGKVRPDNRTTVNVGETVKYSCMDGFRIRGRRSRQCWVPKKHPRLKGILPECKDKNECRKRPCDRFATCTNTVGSYSCVCEDGYEGDGKTCSKLTTTIASTTTSPPGCSFENKYYPPGTVIETGRFAGWCFAIICDASGKVIQADSGRCVPTTPIGFVTSSTGCHHNGQQYNPGTIIESKQSGALCHWIICDIYGYLMEAEDFKCATTPSPTIRTTVPTGCMYGGKNYPPGTVIDSGSSNGWCYRTVCDENGQIIAADDFDCTTAPTTSPTSTPALQ